MRFFSIFSLFLLLFSAQLPAQDERVASIAPEDLKDFENYPPAVKDLVRRSLTLTQMNLRYTYGSADPAKGGMDCSGTIHHMLLAAGVKNVPRQANTLYGWAWKNSRFHAVVSPNLTSFEFQHLKPGDLLFWSGTYAVDRDPPVTHVMMYLGRLKTDDRRVMFGASSGRRYAGKSRDGVSVFDFVLPKSGGEGRFLGYAAIPGLEHRGETVPEKIPVPAMTDPTPAEKVEPLPLPVIESPSPVTPPSSPITPDVPTEAPPPPRAIPVEPGPTHQP